MVKAVTLVLDNGTAIQYKFSGRVLMVRTISKSAGNGAWSDVNQELSYGKRIDAIKYLLGVE